MMDRTRSISRRDFLRLSALAAVGAAASACGQPPLPPLVPDVAPLVASGTSQVAAIRGQDLYTMTREVLEALGGMGRIVNPGETVFIKPNMVTLPWAGPGGNPLARGECTKVEIAAATAEACLEAGAREVIIGDGSQMPRFDWERATTLDGATNLAAEAARLTAAHPGTVRLACLEVDSPDWVEAPTGIPLGRVAISTLVTKADRVISIPVLKTHRWAGMTLSLKNFIGITALERHGWKNAPDYDRPDLHRDAYSPEAMAQLYMDLVDAVRPDLAIIDASVGLEGDGPTVGEGRGRTVDMRQRLGSWLVLASSDLVAADATAARVANHDEAYANRILATAQARGLGNASENRIEVLGERLDDLRVRWQAAKLATEGR